MSFRTEKSGPLSPNTPDFPNPEGSPGGNDTHEMCMNELEKCMNISKNLDFTLPTSIGGFWGPALTVWLVSETVCTYLFMYVHQHICLFGAGMGLSTFSGMSEIFKNSNISQTPATYPLRTLGDGICQGFFRWVFR
jgi:hypothetical protein